MRGPPPRLHRFRDRRPRAGGRRQDHPGRRAGEALHGEGPLKRGLVAAGAVASYLLVAIAVAEFLGIGGYRAGWVPLVAVLAGGGAALTWWLIGLGPRTSGRSTYAVAVAIIGVVFAALLAGRAPLSKGRLTAALDDLPLAFFTKTGQHVSGHSWCRPSCPVVVRTYKGPDLTPKAIAGSVANALAARRLVTGSARIEQVPDDSAAYRIKGERVRVRIETKRRPPKTNDRNEVITPGSTVVTVRLSTFRP